MPTQSVTTDLQAPAAPPPEASVPIILALWRPQSAQADGRPFAPRPAPQASLAPWRAKRIAEHIEANLAGALPLSELARIAQLSASHFSRAFKGAFGQTPHAFITSRRVERARREMLASREPLSQIALACGFADQAHLGRVFRRMTGQAPSQWRRANQPRGSSPSAATRQQESSRPRSPGALRLVVCSDQPPRGQEPNPQ